MRVQLVARRFCTAFTPDLTWKICPANHAVTSFLVNSESCLTWQNSGADETVQDFQSNTIWGWRLPEQENHMRILLLTKLSKTSRVTQSEAEGFQSKRIMWEFCCWQNCQKLPFFFPLSKAIIWNFYHSQNRWRIPDYESHLRFVFLTELLKASRWRESVHSSICYLHHWGWKQV